MHFGHSCVREFGRGLAFEMYAQIPTRHRRRNTLRLWVKIEVTFFSAPDLSGFINFVNLVFGIVSQVFMTK